jgi:hypothetical protein
VVAAVTDHLVVCVTDVGRSVANVTVPVIYDNEVTTLRSCKHSGMIFHKLQDII